MILECTKCNARFLVADSMVPPEGRTVRCGACANQWFVNGSANATAAEPVADAALIPEFAAIENNGEGIEVSGNVPALSKKRISVRPFKVAVPLLAIAWLCLAFITYFPRWMEFPLLPHVYTMFGVTTTDGLLFDNIHMEREEAEERTTFILTGSIVNHASEMRKVPTVHVALKDGRGKPLWGRDYEVNVELQAGEVYPFRIDNVETSFAEDVKSIVMDVGHPLQLMVRK